jgi:Uma2 family endonuclease
VEAADKRLYELVDEVLVEKVMGLREAVYGGRILGRMEPYVERHQLGFVVGADGPMEILPNLVRIPDVSFVSWDDVPGDDIPEEPVPQLVPRLAVEVVSKGNTPGEMARKLHDYFEAGVRLVWFIYPKTQSAEVCTSPTSIKRLTKNQSLDGGDVLPGFRLPLKEIFQRAIRRRGR